MLSPVPTVHTNYVVWGSVDPLKLYKMSENIQPFLFLSRISLRMILVALSHTGAKLSLDSLK